MSTGNVTATLQRTHQPAAPCVVRHMRSEDEAEIVNLLRNLSSLYPDADVWLARRLAEVREGLAWCFVADVGPRIRGVAIAVPKSDRTLKLSTVFVAPESRGQRIGASLVDQIVGCAKAHGYGELYVTVAHHLFSDLAQLLLPRSFAVTAYEPDRYGPGRDEVVFTALIS